MEKYDTVLLSKDEMVCLGCSSDDGNQSFYMYREVFSELGVRVPFSSFQIAVLNFLRVAPSQLHPNSWGFIGAFEIFFRVYNLLCTV